MAERLGRGSEAEAAYTQELANPASISCAVAGLRRIAPETGSMTFMMSKQQNLGDKGGHFTAHLMFYLPQQPESNFGGQFADVPMGYNPQFEHSPEAMSVLMVMVPRWSDGSPVPMDHH